MGEFCEFEIDFEQFDDLRAVVVHDECGAHEAIWFYRNDELAADNAKLRELVKDVDEVADPPLREFLVRRMRALGIEVE